MLHGNMSQQRTTKGEVFTYVAVPLETLQTTTNGQQLESVTTQNVILKAMPDGSVRIIDTNHFLNSQAVAPMTVETEPIICVNSGSKPQDNLVDLKKNSCLKRNKENRQKRQETIKCPLCNEAFMKLPQYRKHMQEHRNMMKFKCTECSASYNVESNLKLHMAMHCKGTPTCPVCSRKFQRIASLKSHLMLHEVEELVSCPECNEEFRKEEDLEEHLDTHKKEYIVIEKPDDLTFICAYCNYLFEDREAYKEHISYHLKMRKLVLNRQRKKRNANVEYAHKCDICKKSFPKVSLLERHMRIHSGEKPFVCHICNRGFAQNGTLQVHLTKHQGLKPYACTLCPAKFNQKGNLRVHLEKTHTAPVPGEKVYKCNLCTCIYKRVATLNGHISKAHAGASREMDEIYTVMEQLKALEKQTKPADSKNKSGAPEVQAILSESRQGNRIESGTTAISKRVHEDVRADDNSCVSYVKLADSSVDGVIRRYVVMQRRVGDIRWYGCSYCTKEFKKPSDLIRHIRVHTREKPFKCKQCNQAFSLKSTLDSHINTHIGSRNYTCGICVRTFTSVRTLNVHMRKHQASRHSNSTQIVSNSTVLVQNTESNVYPKSDEVLKQPIVETVDGLLPVSAPKPWIPPGQMEQYKSRPYKCLRCDAAFKKSVHLKRHTLRHTGEKNFKCDVCPKSFYTGYALKEHLSFHKGIRNFACKICNKRFVTNAILNRHHTIHTSYKPYICPYCKKRFKTVVLCRKHIKVHKKDKPCAPQVVLRDSDAVEELPVVPLGISQKDNAGVIRSAKEPVNPGHSEQETVKIVDGVQENINILNPQLYQLTTNNEINWTAEDVNNPDAPTIFISCDELQALNTNLYYNADVPQVKLQVDVPNSQPLLVNDAANVVFPADPTLSNNSFCVDQIVEVLNPNIFLNNVSGNVDSNIAENNQSDKSNTAETDGILLTVSPDSAFQNINFIAGNNAALSSDLGTLNLSLQSNETIGDSTVVSLLLPSVSSQDTLFNTQGLELVCSECKMEFSTEHALKKHSCFVQEVSQVKEVPKSKGRKKTVASSTQLECPFCKKTFKNRSAYSKHMEVHKQKKSSTYACVYCTKSFKKPSDLARHIRTHTGEKPFKCDKCDRSFSLKSTLECHFRTHNPVGNKEFNCNVCNSYFSSRASLKVHLMLHTDSKPYQCRFCPAKFRTSGHRKSHETVHEKNGQVKSNKANNVLAAVALNSCLDEMTTVEQPEQIASIDVGCVGPQLNKEDIMGHTIQIDPVLFQHLQSSGLLLQQSGEGEGPSFILDIDGGFVINSKLTDNDKLGDEIFGLSIPESAPLIEKPKNFECDVCLRKYSSKDVLTKHVKRHGKDESLRCSKCNDKGFGSKEELVEHLKLHMGYRPFACPLCTNSFGEEGSLKTHMRRIHQAVYKDAASDFPLLEI